MIDIKVDHPDAAFSSALSRQRALRTPPVSLMTGWASGEHAIGNSISPISSANMYSCQEQCGAARRYLQGASIDCELRMQDSAHHRLGQMHSTSSGQSENVGDRHVRRLDDGVQRLLILIVGHQTAPFPGPREVGRDLV